MRKFGAALSAVALLAGCNNSGGGASAPTASAPTPTPTPAPTSGNCTLRARQDWAAAQIREWYLFPETLPASLDPTPYGSVSDYIDALTATARAQNRDRFFTYLTSISGENAFFNQGQSGGFGVRLATDGVNRLFVTEAFEGAPALAAGIDRGAEILGIGTTTGNVQLVSALVASGGFAAVSDALGPDTAGTTRVLRVRDGSGTRDLTVTKQTYTLLPVSSRYGAVILNDGGRRVGYINLRTFISTADQALRDAFANFRSQGITNVIVDFRYNGGGLLSTAKLLNDLMGAARSTSDVQSYTVFRPEKSSNNTTDFFAPQPQSIAPLRLAFIGTGNTASASEEVINVMIPYLSRNMALVGSNTYGKPVGQIGLDRAECDDRLRVVALKTQNRDRQGDYFTGLAGLVPVTCRASDDLSQPLGSVNEASIRAALNFLAGQSCTPIGAVSDTTIAGAGATGQSAAATIEPERAALTPDRPSPAQREVPGLF